MILNFINKGHNGDLHYSKGFMRDLYNILSPEECFLFHSCKRGVVKDLEFLDNNKPLYIGSDFDRYDVRAKTESFGKNIFINTWVFERFFNQYFDYGCSSYSNHLAFKEIYKQFGLVDKFNEDVEHYIPYVNFDLVEKENVNKFVQSNKNKKILICNGPVLSNQSTSFDFLPVVEKLSGEYKDMQFILTQDSDLRRDNIFYTSEITKTEGCDLNEISYLSEFCDVIVGRASGPACFTHTKNNFFNKEKVMVAFTSWIYEGFWYLTQDNGCKQIWSNDYSFESVYKKIKEGIHYR
jgi:hypothetical protein